jgi:hypothetical protein
MKPNFLVIGAAKSATTSLCWHLEQHADVCMAKPKEAYFFSHDERYERGWEWYARYFRHHKGEKAVGEGSISYSMTGVYPCAVERIASDLPEARLLYITRDPLERIESLWIEWRNGNAIKVPASFSEAVRCVPHFIDSSLYWKQIDAYRAHFPDDQILVLFFEDFKADPAPLLSPCFEFLGVGVPDRIVTTNEPRNVSAGKRQDTRLLSVARRLHGFDSTRDVLPGSFRRVMRRVFKRTIKGRPQWDAATRRWVLDQIGEDARTFLKVYDKPADFWSLEAEPQTTST